MGTFSGKLTAPAQTGIFRLSFGARHDGEAFGPSIAAPATEVTCSDGVYCNGAERFVAGQCVGRARIRSDDKADCTTDTCDEATGTCAHELSAGCAKCISDCMPDCTGKVCGGDGCGGTCGGCAAGQACDGSGQCKSVNQPGTCSSPLELLPAGTPFVGVHKLTGDTTDGVHEAVPTCNSTSTAVEKVYTFTLAEKMGIEARVSGYDTVLHVRKEDPATLENECTSNKPLVTVGCSDDAAPPGNYGSRVDAALDPGKYYLIVDGFDSSQLGPFDLQVKFAANGCVPHCDGLYCGADDGCGGDCGTCDPGFACSKDGVCKPDPCTPDCKGKQCGDDGCGGSCGACADGSLCVPTTSTCQVFAQLRPRKTRLRPALRRRRVLRDRLRLPRRRATAMPDLVIDENRLANEILFDTIEASASSCAVIEKCVGGTGTRKVVRFSVEAKNQGQATVVVPPPPERPDLFMFSPCHGHYHFSGFASYALLDKEGNEILKGQKQAYCMEDTQQIAFGPNVGLRQAVHVRRARHPGGLVGSLWKRAGLPVARRHGRPAGRLLHPGAAEPGADVRGGELRQQHGEGAGDDPIIERSCDITIEKGPAPDSMATEAPPASCPRTRCPPSPPRSRRGRIGSSSTCTSRKTGRSWSFTTTTSIARRTLRARSRD